MKKIILSTLMVSIIMPVRAGIWDYVDKRIVISSTTIALGLTLWFALRREVQKRANTMIGLIHINGFITDSTTYIRQLRHFIEDTSVKGILLVFESPGGCGGSVDSLKREIQKACRKKPIVALVQNQCCSGAFLAACATKRIIAPGLSQVGSIGSRLDHIYRRSKPIKYQIDTSGLTVTQAQMDEEIIYAGEFKNAGSPDHALNDKERALMQNMVDECYEQICNDIAQLRNLNKNEAPIWANGKPFTGSQAYQLNLIDTIGSFSDAEQALRDLITKNGGHIQGKLVFVAQRESLLAQVASIIAFHCASSMVNLKGYEKVVV